MKNEFKKGFRKIENMNLDQPNLFNVLGIDRIKKEVLEWVVL